MPKYDLTKIQQRELAKHLTNAQLCALCIAVESDIIQSDTKSHSEDIPHVRKSVIENLQRQDYLDVYLYKSTLYYNPTDSACELYTALMMTDNENENGRSNIKGEKLMTTTVTTIYENTAAIDGSSPDVPVETAVLAELARISGDDPLYITLPVAFADGVSRNGRKYSQETAQAIMDQINAGSVTGQKGHVRTQDRPYVFETPPLIWLGAVKEGNTVWAKAYVMKEASDVREYVSTAKATGSKVGTSIYGVAQVDMDGNVAADGFVLESIDLSHPARLGLPDAGRVPHVTAETVIDETDKPLIFIPGADPSKPAPNNGGIFIPGYTGADDSSSELIRIPGNRSKAPDRSERNMSIFIPGASS